MLITYTPSSDTISSKENSSENNSVPKFSYPIFVRWNAGFTKYPSPLKYVMNTSAV